MEHLRLNEVRRRLKSWRLAVEVAVVLDKTICLGKRAEVVVERAI
jgi:hypothetical protein